MRQWFRSQALKFGVWSQDRREYLDAFNDVIDTYPIHRRVWRPYIYWIVMPGGIKLYFWGRPVQRKCITIYYKITDRVFGGDRYWRYLQRLKTEIEQREKERERSKQIQSFTTSTN